MIALGTALVTQKVIRPLKTIQDSISENANQILYTLNSFEQLKAINQAIEEEKKANPVQEGH